MKRFEKEICITISSDEIGWIAFFIFAFIGLLILFYDFGLGIGYFSGGLFLGLVLYSFFELGRSEIALAGFFLFFFAGLYMFLVDFCLGIGYFFGGLFTSFIYHNLRILRIKLGL